jgi:hypothetical protein
MFAAQITINAAVNRNKTDSLFLFQTGEKIFRQKPDSAGIKPACIDCHYVVFPDTFSLNPAAFEITFSASKLTAEEFTELITDPLGSDRLMDAHQHFIFSKEELGALQFYLTHLKTNVVKKRTKPGFFPVLFAVGILFLIFAVYDYFRSVNLLHPKVRHILFFSGLCICTWVTVAQARLLGNSLNYEPDQPIRFSHLVHAGENKLDCKFCHASAEHAAIAGIPSTRQCYFCHFQIREGSRAGEFELKKVLAAWEQTKPIEWLRVCNLPDHVKFDHSAHVKTAKLECIACHGQVEMKHRIKQETSMTMNWCLDCHNKSYINLKKSGFYINMSIVQADSVLFSDIGGRDCFTCHF